MCHDVIFFRFVAGRVAIPSWSSTGILRKIKALWKSQGLRWNACASSGVVQAVRLVPLSRAGAEKETGCKRERAFEKEQLSKKSELKNAHRSRNSCACSIMNHVRAIFIYIFFTVFPRDEDGRGG